jgi:ParB-like nuclease family protein
MPTKPAASWRDVLPIHLAAERFPLMTSDELRALAEDIKQNGLRNPCCIAEDEDGRVLLFDGRNRLDALELIGEKITLATLNNSVIFVRFEADYIDIPERVVSLNIHRRHLTAEQKRDLIAELIKATPGRSDRQIAKTMRASPTTVGTVRASMEAKGEVSKLDTRTDAKGVKQPAKKPRSRAPKPKRLSDAEINQIYDAAERRMAAAEQPPRAEPPLRDDVGPDSASEAARLRSCVEALQADKRRLEMKVEALEREVEDLRRENAGLRESLEQASGKFIKLSGEFVELRDRMGRPALPAVLPPADPGEMPPIPKILQRAP